MADASLIETIVTTYRERQDYLHAVLRLEAQADAMRRRWRTTTGQLPDADVSQRIAPLITAADQLRTHLIATYDKPLARLAKQLPVYPWAKAVRGFGDLSLAKIVGEAHDLSGYPDHAKLWKRMGLAVMPDGTRQRRVTGDAALAHGYNPARRSLMFLIGDVLIKQNESYRDIYRQRKAYELANHPEMIRMVAHMRAHRYMEKRFVRDLWQAWRAAERANLLE